MKKILSIFLLSVFLFDLFGYFPLFKIAQYKIQKEVKKLLKGSIPENEQVVITVLSKKINNLDWEKEGKEFRYNGTMYDVIKTETKGKFVYYHCINDKQETQLFVHLEDLVNQQMNNDKSPIGKTAKNIAKMFSAFKYIHSSGFIFTPNYSYISKNFFYSTFFHPVFLEVFIPPPERLV